MLPSKRDNIDSIIFQGDSKYVDLLEKAKKAKHAFQQALKDLDECHEDLLSRDQLTNRK